MKKILILLSLALTMAGCTKINDGYVGIGIGRSNGEIPDQPILSGWTQTITKEVIEVSTRNIILNINANPTTKENGLMKSFDVRVNYGINPQTAPFIYKSEKASHTITEDGDIYLLGKYVDILARSAISDTISQYDAMQINQNRNEIEIKIKNSIIAKLKAAGKLKYLNINEVNVVTVEPPQFIIDSVQRIIKSENERQVKENELKIAKLEQEKMEILAKQANEQYINLVEADAKKTSAEALKTAAEKGNLITYIVPNNFTSLGNMNHNK